MANELLIEDSNPDKQLIINDVKSKKPKYMMVLIILGLLNNIGYVFVNSSAQALGKDFGEENLMSVFTFCLTLLSTLTSFVNSKYLLKLRHFTKIQIMLSIYTVSYLLLGLSNLIHNLFGFALALFGSVLIGVATTLGEQTNLGFLKGFAPDLISGWGCGTGFAGVFGAGINFILRYYNVPGYIIFLGMIPTNLIYLFGFMWLKNQKVHQIEQVRTQSFSGGSFGEPQAGHVDKGEADINQVMSASNFFRVWPLVWTLAINLAVVYFLEYGIISGFAGTATDKYVNATDPNPAYTQYAYIILNFCYQCGVVISRTSLVLFKIKHVWIVSALQFINYILWAWIAKSQEIPLEWLFVLMVWVGLMGGASYVNVLYQTLESETIEKKDKEIAINILSICNNTGILLTTLLATLFDNTIYKGM